MVAVRRPKDRNKWTKVSCDDGSQRNESVVQESRRQHSCGADYNRRSMRVSGASALRSFDYLTRLAGAKTGMEAIEISGAHYRNQLTALGEYADNLVGLAREMRAICLDRSERSGP